MRSRRALVRPRGALVAAACALALAGSCGREEESDPGTAPPFVAKADAAEDLVLPPAGATRVERRGERYDVASNEALPLDALRELSEVAGFRVETGRRAPGGARRTLWLQGVSLERAVAAILAGVPHEVHHEPSDGDLDPERPFEGRAITLSRVMVGEAGASVHAGRSPQARAPRRARPGGPGKEARARRSRGDERADERGERAERLRAGEAERAESVARDAEDPDTDVRLEAVQQMEPDEGDRAWLERLLREDSSPEVRAAAAGRLSEGDPFGATPGLLAALSDPDPVVLEAVVGALGDVYDEAPDPRIREALAPLREHRDADVRAAVEEFDAWTEE